MKVVRRTTEPLWNALFGFSIAVIAVSVGFLFLRGSLGRRNPSTVQLTRMRDTAAKADKTATAARSQVTAEEWAMDSETLGSAVLDVLTQMVDKHGLQLSSFRTEKPITVAHLREAPFVANVEGSYSDLLSLLKTLEDPNAKLTLNMIEVTASDHGTGQIVATLGLVAFLPEVKP